MQRSEAIAYMEGLGLTNRTARAKIGEATRTAGQPVEVRTKIMLKAVRIPGRASGGGEIAWDFTFYSTKR